MFVCFDLLCTNSLIFNVVFIENFVQFVHADIFCRVKPQQMFPKSNFSSLYTSFPNYSCALNFVRGYRRSNWMGSGKGRGGEVEEMGSG